MSRVLIYALPILAALSGCALNPPSTDKLAAMPLVTYPDKPTSVDYVYKLPAGKPLDVNVRAEGSALTATVEQKISASLARDLYLHKQWASEDGKSWKTADKLIGVNLRVSLPSYEAPGPGEIYLGVDRKSD
jgi:uncharacterized protein (DUF1697 family)